MPDFNSPLSRTHGKLTVMRFPLTLTFSISKLPLGAMSSLTMWAILYGELSCA